MYDDPPGAGVSVACTEHVAIPVVPATRLQVVKSKNTIALPLNVTVPKGLVAPLVLVSVTVAVHVEA